MSHASGAAHLGSALSCVDILVAAYWNALKIDPQQTDDPDRDRFILSKGHASAALYATLAARGFVPPEKLTTYGQNGSRLAEQMSPRCLPGVEAATGSLGHGLSLGLGMALAARIQNRSYRVWVLMSDGECNEGSVWEAAMFASAQALDNVTVIIDYNGWQATGRSDEIMALPPLKDKWESFGFAVQQVDGHDLKALPVVFAESTRTHGRPSCIIADTVKGKGVSFMEDDNNWHYRVPNDEELETALAELGQQ
jgi:transketolase